MPLQIYKRVANETTTRRMRLICVYGIAAVSLFLIFASTCSISLFSFNFFLIVRFHPLFYTNASESLQTSYDYYKCVVINKNGLQLLKNMLQICFPYGICEHVSNVRNTS